MLPRRIPKAMRQRLGGSNRSRSNRSCIRFYPSWSPGGEIPRAARPLGTPIVSLAYEQLAPVSSGMHFVSRCRMRIAIAFALALIGVSAGLAHADAHCASDNEVTAGQATKIASLLPRGAQFFELYPDASVSSWKTLNNLSIEGSGSASRQIYLDGVGMAIGGIYYLAKNNKAYNLALAVGCSVEGVPTAFDVPPPAPQVPAGSRRFKISLRIDVMSSDANGQSWDWIDGVPDLVVHGGLYLNGKTVRSLSCRNPNTLTATCLNGTIIDASEDTWLVLNIDDTGGENEAVGKLSVSLRDAVRNGGRPINVRTSGQIKSATLRLIPVE